MQRNICIIDDDLVSQFATRYCIEQYGENVSISTCSDAEEALAKLSKLLSANEKLPDIVFLDLVMGDMHGWEFLEKLQQLAIGKQLPEVYILSAFTNSKDRAIAKEHNLISGYMDKPLSRTSLDKIFSSKTKSESSTL
jgi:CheY-like chemotaxis protein